MLFPYMGRSSPHSAHGLLLLISMSAHPNTEVTFSEAFSTAPSKYLFLPSLPDH